MSRNDSSSESPQKPIARLPPRAEGLTPSENRLAKLCQGTFLTLWSYAGVYRDQGAASARKIGKEVCDLLVVFGDHIIIFSDKTCNFPESGNLDVDWSRWYQRAVLHSAKQIRGAERWIRSHPDRLFLDPPCSHPFPYPLPDPTSMRMHRVIVAGGASERCRKDFGGRGSLIVSFGGSDSELIPAPFHLAPPSGGTGFVHVFDEVTLGILLEQLDTVSDFVAYLEAKERLAHSGRLVYAAGEEELLARYLIHINSSGAHDFAVPKKVDGIFLDEGGWDSFTANPQLQAKREADRISYAWDGLIEKFTHYAATGEAEFGDSTSISEFEKGLRFLAAEPRVKRRVLANALLGIMKKAETGRERATRIIMPLSPSDPFYVFLALQRPKNVSNEDYRAVRRDMLHSLCLATRARWPRATDVVGIATEPLISSDRSEDLAYLDGRKWDAEAMAEAEEGQRRYNFFRSLRLFTGHDKEYPIGAPGSREPTRKSRLHVGRNDPCPCNSGRKFKMCCGRAGRDL